MSPTDFYTPLIEYQTRLMVLHGDQGDPASELVCKLHVVDLLRPEFGPGLGLRNLPAGEKRGRLVTYEALSYCWGGSTTTRTLSCEDSPFPITENLYEALLELRCTGTHVRWLWVDAICINQDDDEEKAMQIPHMMHVYEQASRVIAWLGRILRYTNILLHIANSPMEPDDLEGLARLPVSGHCLTTLCEALEELYNKPYFQRIWVQQEIFAARHLRLRCGAVELPWRGLISNPCLLLNTHLLCHNPDVLLLNESDEVHEAHRRGFISPVVSDHIHSFRGPKLSRALELFHSPADKDESAGRALLSFTDALDRFRTIDQTVKTFIRQAGCFRSIRANSLRGLPIDLVDALLLTGNLQVTDSRDRVYGLLSMTRNSFESCVVTVDQWMRRSQALPPVIPIDYSCHHRTLQIIVMRLLLMEGGLSLIPKFQCASKHTLDESGSRTTSAPAQGSDTTSTLPSWVVDWQLASTVFVYNKKQPYAAMDPDRPLDKHHELYDAWYEQPRKSKGRGNPPYEAFPEHAKFRQDNMGTCEGTNIISSLEKLVVRGQQDDRFVVRGRDVVYKGTFEKFGETFVDPKMWSLDLTPSTADIIISAEAYTFESMDAGLWLLHPVGNDIYRITAFLSWNSIEDVLIYRSWEAGRGRRRLLIGPLSGAVYFLTLAGPSRGGAMQKYTIV